MNWNIIWEHFVDLGKLIMEIISDSCSSEVTVVPINAVIMETLRVCYADVCRIELAEESCR